MSDVVLEGSKSWIIEKWRQRWKKSAVLTLEERSSAARATVQRADLVSWSQIVGEFIAAHSAPVALREGVLYVRVLQPALHYELEQVSRIEILRKLKQRFGTKVIRDIRFRLG